MLFLASHASGIRVDKGAITVDVELTEWFKVTVGVKQGCDVSADLFLFIVEAMMQRALHNFEGGVRVSGKAISNLRLADDVDVIAESVEQL